MASLIGTASDQVPTNGDLGDMAYQSREHVDVKRISVEGKTSTGIAFFDSEGELQNASSVLFNGVDLVDGRGSLPSQFNPLLKSHRVSMAGDSGSSAVMKVLNDADFNPGVDAFSITHIILPTGYVGSSGTRHNAINNQAGTSVNLPILFFALSGGLVTPNLYINTVQFAATTTISSAEFLLGAEWTVTYYPPSTISDGRVTFYRNGVIFGTVLTVPAGTPHTFTGSDLILEGTSGSREGCSWYRTIFYNRELSSTEVAAFYRRSYDLSDIDANQTELTSWTWTNYAGASGFETFTTSGSDITSAINSSGLGIATTTISFTRNRKYRVKMNITVNSGSVELKLSSGTDLSSGGLLIRTITAANDGELDIEFTTPTEYSSSYIGFYSLSSSNFSVSGFKAKRIGVVADWSAENAQTNNGQVLDSTANKNHMIMSSSASVVIPPKQNPVITSTHTWSASSTLQYITNFNQSVAPVSGWCIEDIFITTSASIYINLGNGSSSTYYMNNKLYNAGTHRIANADIANFGPDGTNAKFTIQPSSSVTATVSIAITLRMLP